MAYQDEIKQFIVYDQHLNGIQPLDAQRLLALQHLMVSIQEETGELAGKIKRLGRGDHQLDGDYVEDIGYEIGDILFYLADLCNKLGLGLDEVMEANLTKLHSRKQRGVIRGSGDER